MSTFNANMCCQPARFSARRSWGPSTFSLECFRAIPIAHAVPEVGRKAKEHSKAEMNERHG